MPASGQTIGPKYREPPSEWGAIIVPQGVASGIYAGASFGLGTLRANESASLSLPSIFGNSSASNSSSTNSNSNFSNSNSSVTAQTGTATAFSDRQWGALGDIFLGYSAVLPNRIVLGLQGEGTLSRTSVRLNGTTSSVQNGTSSTSSSSNFSSPGFSSFSNSMSAGPTAGTVISGFSDQITSEWMASALVRAGYLIDPLDLIYVIGGYTYGRFSSPGQVALGSFQFGMNGATIGGGWERRLSPSWTIRGEYRYTEFRGNDDQTGGFSSTSSSSTSGLSTTTTGCNTCTPSSTTTNGTSTSSNTGSSFSPSSFSAHVSASVQTLRIGIVHYFNNF